MNIVIMNALAAAPVNFRFRAIRPSKTVIHSSIKTVPAASRPNTPHRISLRERLEKTEPFDEEAVERVMRAMIAERGLAPAGLIQPTRVALTGRTKSPGIFETIALLGKEKTIARLKRALRMAGPKGN